MTGLDRIVLLPGVDVSRETELLSGNLLGLLKNGQRELTLYPPKACPTFGRGIFLIPFNFTAWRRTTHSTGSTLEVGPGFRELLSAFWARTDPTRCG